MEGVPHTVVFISQGTVDVFKGKGERKVSSAVKRVKQTGRKEEGGRA